MYLQRLSARRTSDRQRIPLRLLMQLPSAGCLAGVICWKGFAAQHSHARSLQLWLRLLCTEIMSCVRSAAVQQKEFSIDICDAPADALTLKARLGFSNLVPVTQH